MISPKVDALCLRCKRPPKEIIMTRDLMNTGIAISVICHNDMAHEHIHDRHLEPFEHAKNVTITLRPFGGSH